MSVVEKGSPASAYLWVEKDPDEEVTEKDIGSIMRGITEREDAYTCPDCVNDLDCARSYFLSYYAPKIADDTWNKILDAGHTPLYVKVEVIDVRQYAGLPRAYSFKYRVEAHLRIEHASPFPWAWVIASVILLVIAAYAAEQISSAFERVFEGLTDWTRASTAFLSQLFQVIPWVLAMVIVVVMGRLLTAMAERTESQKLYS